MEQFAGILHSRDSSRLCVRVDLASWRAARSIAGLSFRSHASLCATSLFTTNRAWRCMRRCREICMETCSCSCMFPNLLMMSLLSCSYLWPLFRFRISIPTHAPASGEGPCGQKTPGDEVLDIAI